MIDINIFSLTPFDYLILGIIAVSVIFAIYRGFVSSLLSFIGWVISIYIGLEVGPIFAPMFKKIAGSDSMAAVLGSFIVFIVVAIILAMVNSLINKCSQQYFRGLLDRSFGLVFGLFRGCFLVSLLFYFMTMAITSLNVDDEDKFHDKDSKVPEWAKKSETIILLKRGSDLISAYIPKSFEQDVHQSVVDATNEEGNVELPNTRAEKIHSLNKVLNSLPEELLNKTSDTDLITLQDMSASPGLKIQILEKLANEYFKYNNEKIVKGSNIKEIENNNKKYHRIMMMLEEEILKYRMQERETSNETPY